MQNHTESTVLKIDLSVAEALSEKRAQKEIRPEDGLPAAPPEYASTQIDVPEISSRLLWETFAWMMLTPSMRQEFLYRRSISRFDIRDEFKNRWRRFDACTYVPGRDGEDASSAPEFLRDRGYRADTFYFVIWLMAHRPVGRWMTPIEPDGRSRFLLPRKEAEGSIPRKLRSDALDPEMPEYLTGVPFYRGGVNPEYNEERAKQTTREQRMGRPPEELVLDYERPSNVLFHMRPYILKEEYYDPKEECSFVGFREVRI